MHSLAENNDSVGSPTSEGAVLSRLRSSGIKHEFVSNDTTTSVTNFGDRTDNSVGASEEARQNIPRDKQPIAMPPQHGNPVFCFLSLFHRDGARRLATNTLACDPEARMLFQENGRIYHGREMDGYMLPCDEKEQDRLDFIHSMFMAAWGSVELIHVPHPINGRFLDLGCGAGIWAKEVAEAYPMATVLGVDICAIQPKERPPNCIIVAPLDYEKPWLIGESRWDVIHLRMGCGSVVDWPRLYDTIFNHLQNGAWFEQWEIDFEPCCNNRSLQGTHPCFWYRLLKEATTLSRREIAHCPGQTQHWLRETGFSDISHECIVLPLNRWSGRAHNLDIARWYSVAFFESVEPLCMATFSRVLGWSGEDIIRIVDGTRKEALDQHLQAFHTLHIYRARRPDRCWTSEYGRRGPQIQ